MASAKTSSPVTRKNKPQSSLVIQNDAARSDDFSKAAPAYSEKDLLIDGIKSMYWVENHLVKSLTKMIDSANSSNLANVITQHLKVTKNHVLRIEKAFKLLGLQPQAKKCEAIESMTKEGEIMIEVTDMNSITRDLSIISSSQKVEHHEMACYKSLAQLANAMGMNELNDLFLQTLKEETEADVILTDLSGNLNKPGKSK